MSEEEREMEVSEAAVLLGKASKNKFQKLINNFIPHMKRNTKRHEENTKLENEVNKLKSKKELIEENISLKKKNDELRAEITRLKKEVERLTLIDRGILKENVKKQNKNKTKVKDENIKISNEVKEASGKTKVEEYAKEAENQVQQITNEKFENIIDFSQRKENIIQCESKEPNKTAKKDVEKVKKSKVSEASKEIKITNTIDDLKLFGNFNTAFNVGEVVKDYGVKAAGEEKTNKIFKRLLDLRADGYVEFKDGNLNDIKNAEFLITEKGKGVLEELKSKDSLFNKENDSKSTMEKIKEDAKAKSINAARKNLETQKNIQALKETNIKAKNIKSLNKTVAR